MNEVVIVNIEPQYFAPLEALQRACYPTLGSGELMRAEHFAAQHKNFRDGQFVALLDGRVVGQGSGFYIDFDFAHPHHTFREITAGLTFACHDPNGAYYYGADISVRPDFRGRGIGSRIYRARQALAQRDNRRGIVTCGLIPGYAAHIGALSAQEYVRRVVEGELRDPTLSFQLRMGFRVRGLIENYIEDSASGNWSTLLEWVNPEYRSPT